METVPPAPVEIVAELELMDRNELDLRLEAWLDGLDATGRWALLKLLTGALRVGVSARLAKTAVAEMAGQSRRGRGDLARHRPALCAALPLARRPGRAPTCRRAGLPPAHARTSAGGRRLGGARPRGLRGRMEVGWHPRPGGGAATTRGSSRAPATTSARAFPTWSTGCSFDAVLDGELLVVRDGEVAPFNDLQQRLNRKA